MTRNLADKLKNTEYIDEEDVPATTRGGFDWATYFGKIQSGKAAKITPDMANYITVREALVRLQRLDKFRNCQVKTRTEGDHRVCYVVNSQNK